MQFSSNHLPGRKEVDENNLVQEHRELPVDNDTRIKSKHHPNTPMAQKVIT